MMEIAIKTGKKREVVDITKRIAEFLKKEKAGEGLVHFLLTHTTAALTTADLDPGTDLDMLDIFDVLIPKLEFRHPHDPEHIPDHILSSLVGTSFSLPFQDGRLRLDAWRKIVLLEFDGPRECSIIFSVISSKR